VALRVDEIPHVQDLQITLHLWGHLCGRHVEPLSACRLWLGSLDGDGDGRHSQNAKREIGR